MIGCTCKVCRSADPRDARLRASALVEYGGLTILVDCGAVQALIKDVTGREPEAVPGKPDKDMIGGIMDKYNLEKDEIMMVGDRIYTDMEMARRAEIPGVLVLTGEATLESLKESGLTPELVLDNISVLADLLVKAKTGK